MKGDPNFVIKIAAGFPQNGTIGVPSGNGLVLLLSAETGAVQAMLHDEMVLTDIPYVLVSGKIIIDDGVANIDLRPRQPIRYSVIEEGESDLDLGDKEYSWHADIETPEDEYSKFPDRPAILEHFRSTQTLIVFP